MKQGRKRLIPFSACFIFIVLISLIIEACSIKVQASSFWDKGKQKVVIITADYIDLQDYDENEYLNVLIDSSYFAFVSIRQTGKATLAKSKLIIGSGKRIEISGKILEQEYYSYSTNSQTKRRETADKSSIAFENIESLKKLNKNNEYKAYIGYLGKELHKNGRTTALIGNSDTALMDRSSIFLAMDESGNIDAGEADNTVIYDSSFPGGKKTDYQKLLEYYKLYINNSDLMVIDTGDLNRLEYYKSKLSEESFKLHKKDAINSLSDFIKKIITDADRNTTFMILSAYPSARDMKASFKLTQFLVYEDDEGGLLYSNSTKRAGIISGLDIADFILKKLNIDNNNVLQEAAADNSLIELQKLKNSLISVSLMRRPVLTWYAIFEIVSAVAAFMYLLNSKINLSILIKPIKIIMLANLAAPVILIYLSAFYINNTSLYFILFILLSITAGILFFAFKSFIYRFSAVAFFVNASIVLDLLNGSALMKSSIFGYDPIIGARFYGIGNELAGVYIGSGILLIGCILQLVNKPDEKRAKLMKILVISYIIFQVFMIGMPFIGSNFGGTIAAVLGYYFFYLYMSRRKLRIAQVFYLVFVLLFALSSIIALDLLNPTKTTHIGKFITDIKENGIEVLLSTISRKAAMNLKLIKYTIWTKVLLCIILIITAMFFKPVQLLRNIFKKYSYLTAAWIGISAGSIAGLIANDSGIVMAATAMIYTGYSILYICLEERSAAK